MTDPKTDPKTEPAVDPKKEPGENTFTQIDVNNVVAKNVKEERAKLLKELGIEDIANAKESLAEYKKLQDSQKTELDKLKEVNAIKENELAKLNEEVSAYKIKGKVSNVLKTLDIDSAYSETIFKLIDISEITEDTTEKEFKSIIETTVEKYLPSLKEGKKVGARKKDPMPKGSTEDYLSDKYKGNPFFKKG